jgi:hypothetical protein
MIEMIRLTVKTAAPAYMSLTAVSTDAGAGGRSGSTGWPLDGQGWYIVTSPRKPAAAGAILP